VNGKLENIPSLSFVKTLKFLDQLPTNYKKDLLDKKKDLILSNKKRTK